MTGWIDAVIQGVLLGGLYALFAAGLSLMFGVMRLVNLAHGALAVLAAYGGYEVVRHWGWNPFATLGLVVPAMALLGYLLQRFLLNRALTIGPLSPLLATFGLAIVVESVLLERFSADSRALPTGRLGTASLRITDEVSIGAFPLLMFAVGVGAVVGLQWYLFRTDGGCVMRATSEDREAAQLMGVDDGHVYAVATAIALALVAVAGIFLGMRTTFTPTAGGGTLLFAFEAVVIGGLGSLLGTLAGSVVLGVAQLVGAAVEPAYGVLTGHLVFLLVLAFRPQGLLPRAVMAT
jgi:branched-chain amino acid transport system permease protein